MRFKFNKKGLVDYIKKENYEKVSCEELENALYM